LYAAQDFNTTLNVEVANFISPGLDAHASAEELSDDLPSHMYRLTITSTGAGAPPENQPYKVRIQAGPDGNSNDRLDTLEVDKTMIQELRTASRRRR